MRKLSLNKEVLADLTTDELGLVLGAQATPLCATDPCITPPISQLRCTFSLGPAVC
jgi:hypothetical protein